VNAPVAAILITGNELVGGRTRDLNGPLVAASLSESGFEVRHLDFVPDDAALIEAALRRLLDEEPALIVTSGGLGTTHDDLTVDAVARATGLPLVEHVEALAFVEAATRRVAARRRLPYDDLLSRTRSQAVLPEGAEIVAPAGLAPGFLLRAGATTLCVLPGVPAEVRVMWPQALETIASRLALSRHERLVVRTYGAGEIQIQPLLDAATLDRLSVGITAAEGEVAVVASYDDHDALARAQARALELILKAGSPVFSDDGSTIDEIVAGWLRGRGQTLAVAESCTGGALGARLTDLAGSSDYFVGGIVSYDNAAKTGLLRVPADTLEQRGAVSTEVASAMAAGARAVMGATYGIGITGVAGPGGGTPDKPVGLVYIACSSSERTQVEEHRFPGDRASVRAWATTAALHLLRQALI